MDLVVVGGGAAGLAAAVAAQEQGLECQVVEAQDRVGGRVHTTDSASGPIDLGAQMINGDMAAVLALAAEAGLWLSPLPTGGAALAVTPEGRTRRSVDARPQDWVQAFADPPLPAGPGGAAASVADVIASLGLPPLEARLAHSAAAELLGQPADALAAEPVRHELTTFDSDRDDAEFQLRGGFGQVTAGLARQLHRPPVLRTPVRAIRRLGSRVAVEAGAAQWLASYVVVAVPPPVARRITFDVPEPGALPELLDAYLAGDVIKFHAVYDRPFWRGEGLSGRADFAEPPGLTVVDGSPDDGRAPRLVAFLGGAVARHWAGLPAAARFERLRQHLGRAFGPAATTPSAIHEAVWVDHPWCGGGYNSQVRAGARPDAAAALARWGDRIAFAGAELAPRFRGYVEGALASGRAAVARLTGGFPAGRPATGQSR